MPIVDVVAGDALRRRGGKIDDLAVPASQTVHYLRSWVSKV